MTTEQRLKDIWRPFAEAANPDATLRRQRALGVALNEDGTIAQTALTPSLPWQRIDYHLPGAVATGAEQGGMYDMPQGGQIVRIALRAKVAPSGGPLTVTLTDGTASQSVSLQDAQAATASGVSMTVATGSTLTLTVNAANGAEDVTVTAHYTHTGG